MVHNRECCGTCEEERVRQTAPYTSVCPAELPKSSCCQAAEQDCRSVSTSKQSCIPGSRLISDTDKNKTLLKPVLRLLVQCNRVAEGGS